MTIEVRSLLPAELGLAGSLLYGAFEGAARMRGHEPPWSDEAEASETLAELLDSEPEGVIVATTGGAVVGLGALRVRGEVASIGSIAVAAPRRGIGTAVLDGLIERADDRHCLSLRVHTHGWNPGAFALYMSRGFGVSDVVVNVHRSPQKAPSLESSRGLEVRPAQADNPRELEEIAVLDRALTGHERVADLRASLKWVARRRGSIIGYLGWVPTANGLVFGPGLSVDASDLFILVQTALAESGDAMVRARLSTSNPVASTAAIALGFEVDDVGLLLSRGAPRPTRTSQLYGLRPEVL